MSSSSFKLIATGIMAGWLAIFSIAGHAATNTQIPPVPPVGADLDGSIQPPIQPTEPPRVVQPAPAIPATTPSGQLPNEIVAWDSEQKEEIVKAGTAEAHFKFNLTNVSAQEVTIFNVHTSCGCTSAHLPPMPWKLTAGTNGEINITMNVAGKNGTISKTVTVGTDKGNKTLSVKTTILQPGNETVMASRENNQQVALADRQAVFKGDCARCHVVPAEGKMGKELYVAACGICHEAEHRATMVPDLHALKHETSRELWHVWITYGKPASLMPAFAKSQGGPLTEPQINSLVDYLAANFPSKPDAVSTPTASK